MSRSNSFLNKYGTMSFERRNCLACRPCPCPPMPGMSIPPEGLPKPPYQTGCVPRYCDILDAGVEGTPEMLQDIIKDMQCVCDKMFGNTRSMEGRNRGLLSKIAALKAELCKLEECKKMLQQELCRIQGELIMAQKAYEDEADQRQCLEELIAQLRQRLARLEAAAEMDAKDKAELASCIGEMERRLKEAYDKIEALTSEILGLQSKLRDGDEYRVREGHCFLERKARCSDLEEALAKCCKANEELKRELEALRKERDSMAQWLEKMKNDIKRLREEIERERKDWANERAAYVKTISDLKKALDDQTLKNQQMCEKLHRSVTEHHKEQEKCKLALKQSCDKHHQEKLVREDLERRLKNCEQRYCDQRSFNDSTTGSYSCTNITPGCRTCEVNNFTC